MSKKLAPEFYDGTLRQWQAQKRREWNEIIKAFEIFHLGCAYTPIYETEVKTLSRTLMLGKAAMSPKFWKGKS